MIPIAIEEVKQLQARLKEINDIPFDQIEWTEHGKSITGDSEVKTFFKFTGLSNCSFITDDFYREKHNG